MLSVGRGGGGGGGEGRGRGEEQQASCLITKTIKLWKFHRYWLVNNYNKTYALFE